MVKIKRTYTPKGLAKTNREFKAAIRGMNVKEAYEFYKRHKGRYRYNTEETKRHFRKMNHERCAFCTKMMQDFEDEMTVEHIKIKRDYPEKIFQWSNLLCVCKTCNTKRSTHTYFPEKYLDPTKIDDIEDYFCYQLDGEIAVSGDLDDKKREQAEYMIKLYGLNRKGLVCKRREFMLDLMSDDDFYEKLKNMDESSQNIIFLSVFAYYRRCKEAYGE